MLTWRRFLVTAVCLAAGAAWSATVSGLFQGGPGEGTPWPSVAGSTIVPVCFRPPGTVNQDAQGNGYTVNYPPQEWLEKQQLVRDALEDSWGKWTRIVFSDWGTCPATLNGYIYVDLIKEDCGGCGDSIPRGYHPTGIRVWLKMENPDERLIRSVVIHEFGHALGFHHEMDRPDAWNSDGTPQCSDGPVKYLDGTYLTPYYDDVSIMNYCAPRNRNGLSAGDLSGAQKLHGTSPEGHWLKALPTLSLYAM